MTNTTATITNIVATFRLGAFFCERAIRWIARYGINTEYNPRHFHSLIMRLRRNGTTISALIFRNSKVVLSGAKSIGDVQWAVRKVTNYVNHGFNKGAKEINDIRHAGNCKVSKLIIRNIVATKSMSYRLNIEKLNNNSVFCKSIYDPTIFPALRAKFMCNDHMLSINFFISGKLVITGAKKIEQINCCVKFLSDFLPQFER